MSTYARLGGINHGRTGAFPLVDGVPCFYCFYELASMPMPHTVPARLANLAANGI